MLGSIIGDIAGSVYEFNPTRSTGFLLLGDGVNYTDDTILTCSVAEWLLDSRFFTIDELEEKFVKYADTYICPLGGYGYSFAMWLKNTWSKRTPYNSYGRPSSKSNPAGSGQYQKCPCQPSLHHRKHTSS